MSDNPIAESLKNIQQVLGIQTIGDNDIEEINKKEFRKWMEKQVIPDNDVNAGLPYNGDVIDSYISEIISIVCPIEPSKSLFYVKNKAIVAHCIKQLYNTENKIQQDALLKYYQFVGGNISTIVRYKTGIFIKFDYERNRIIFGAPGTGKSYTLNKEKGELLDKCKNNFERVTFHPEYSYANFVGTYKPVMKEEIDKTSGKKTEEISYEYVPGPFMRVLAKALKSGMTDSPEPYLLIIEEINRANVAAVFGDVFQLLDRDFNNVSEYEISTSKDMRMYLVKELGVDESEVETIKIPDNMFIWATMNSADQGVFPMDTAFKRRWDFTYLGIDDAEDTMEASIKDKKYTFGIGDDARLVSWNDIRKAINNELSNETYRINEDKLLGPYFISNSILLNASNDEFLKVFKNKVLMYLFEDAVKQRRSPFFDNCKDGNKGIRYSEICKAFDTKGVFIFPESISKEFIEKPSDDEPKDTDE